MRPLPDINETADFLAAKSKTFNLVLEFLTKTRDDTRDMMPSCEAENIGKLQARWNELNWMVEKDGDELRAKMRQFWDDQQD